MEGEIVFDLILDWVYRNPEREVTNAELCKELAKLAREEGQAFPYANNPRGFAQHMVAFRPKLTQFFDITERPVGGHKKKYGFRLK